MGVGVGVGFVWTAVLSAFLGLAAFEVARTGLRQPAGFPRVLAACVLAWTWVVLGVETLGSFGWLARAPLLAWVALGLAGAAACRVARGRVEAERERVDRAPWTWAEQAAVSLVVWPGATYLAVSLERAVKVVSDGPIYHLYFAARWWKAGSLDPIAAPFGENAATYFPIVGDVCFTALMTAYGGDLLAKVGQAPFGLLSMLTVVALAMRLGASRPSAVVAAAWFLTSTPVFVFTFQPNVDTIFVAGFMLAAYFFTRHALGDDGPASLALGAMAAGCALGTKAPAVVFVPPVVLLGLASAIARGPGLRARLVGAAVVVGGCLLTGGFQYVRNAFWTGNPLYPLHLEIAGTVLLRGWYGPDVMRLSPYYIPVTDVRSLADTLLAVLDPRLVPLWLASVGGAWAIGRRPEFDDAARRDRFVWLASGLAVLNVALYWGVVPYRTQQRFMVQALGLAAVPLARLFDRGRVWRGAGVALLAVHVLTPQGWPVTRAEPPWDFTRNVPNAVPGLVRLPSLEDCAAAVHGDVPALAAVLLPPLIGAAAWVMVASWARVAGERRFRHVVAVASTLGLAAVAGAPAYPWGEDARRRFYPPFPDYYPGWLALDLASGPAGTTVAYAGTNIPYYLFGAGLRNDVLYVNIDAHRDWLLHDYHRHAVEQGSGPALWPFPRPGWDRQRPDYDAWLANLRAAGVRLLVVTRADPANGPHNPYDAEGFPIERAWADAHPESFTPLYGRSEGDRLFRLYRVKPIPESGSR
jgi:hypothetical protein